MRTKHTVAVAVGFVVALLAAFFTVPEAAEAQSLAQVYEVQAKQGTKASFEAALERHAKWREENGDPWEWNVYEVVQGKDLNTYSIRSPGHSWSDFDDYGKGFGPKGGQHFQATVGPMVKSLKSRIVRLDTAASHIPEVEGADNPLFEVTHFKLKPGNASDFFEPVTQALDALAEQDYPEPYYVSDVVAGAGDSHAILVNQHRNWADFEEGDPSAGELIDEVLGEEKAEKLFERYNNSYSSSYSVIARPRPDLSVDAAGEEGGQ